MYNHSNIIIIIISGIDKQGHTHYQGIPLYTGHTMGPICENTHPLHPLYGEGGEGGGGPQNSYLMGKL